MAHHGRLRHERISRMPLRSRLVATGKIQSRRVNASKFMTLRDCATKGPFRKVFCRRINGHAFCIGGDGGRVPNLRFGQLQIANCHLLNVYAGCYGVTDFDECEIARGAVEVPALSAAKQAAPERYRVFNPLPSPSPAEWDLRSNAPRRRSVTPGFSRVYLDGRRGPFRCSVTPSVRRG
jgi:hypothetical protein